MYSPSSTTRFIPEGNQKLNNLREELTYKTSLAPASRTTTVNGAAVDNAADGENFGGAMIIIHAGTAGGTTPSFTFEVQDSPDNSTWTAVDASLLDGAEPVVTTANDEQVHLIGYLGIKRYLRVAITAVSGTTPTLLCSAGVALGFPNSAPVA